MTNDEAHVALISSEAGERLKAARYFALHASAEDHRALQNARSKETIPWIKRALDRSLDRAGRPAITSSRATTHEDDVHLEPPKHMLAEVRSVAIDQLASTIIHELSTIVARLKITAPREVNDYSNSNTKVLVDSLAGLLGGIRNLKTAVGKPSYIELDLANECRQTCAIFLEASHVFRFAGPSPFLAEIDPGLFKLALSNVVRNAVEAISSDNTVGDPTITLNWGHAGHEVWVSVIDNGPGFEQNPAGLVDFGKSTKDEHIGFGLATASQAMQAMEGDVYPSHAAERGARVELRWFGSHENIVR